MYFTVPVALCQPSTPPLRLRRPSSGPNAIPVSTADRCQNVSGRRIAGAPPGQRGQRIDTPADGDVC